MVPTLLNPLGIADQTIPGPLAGLVSYVSGRDLKKDFGAGIYRNGADAYVSTVAGKAAICGVVYLDQDGNLPAGEEAFTFSSFVYSTGYSGQYPIYIASNGNYINGQINRVLLYSNNSGGQTRLAVGTNEVVYNIPRADSLWHLYTLVFANRSCKLYVDGAFAVENTNASAPSTLAGNYYVTNTAIVGRACRDIRLYSRSISASEVLEIYNAGK